MNTIRDDCLSGRESAVDHIRADYLLAKPPQQVRGLLQLMEKAVGNSVSDRRTIISENTNRIYQITVGHPNTDFQPPVQYRVAFVKHIIKQLESAECDKACDDDDDGESSALWYDALESLTRVEKQIEPFYRLYELPKKIGIVKVFENENAFVAEGTTGLVTWEASVEITKWLCSSSQEVRRLKGVKWMVELGSGCGLLAVSVLKIFPHLLKYIASDGHSSAVSKCKINLEANFGTLKTDVIQLEQIDWLKDGEKFKKVVRNLTETVGAGVLLGADIVFDPGLLPSLVELIEAFLNAHHESVAFIACTVRNEETLGVLKKCLGMQGENSNFKRFRNGEKATV